MLFEFCNDNERPMLYVFVHRNMADKLLISTKLTNFEEKNEFESRGHTSLPRPLFLYLSLSRNRIGEIHMSFCPPPPFKKNGNKYDEVHVDTSYIYILSSLSALVWPWGIRPPCMVTDRLSQQNQLSINLRKRGPWGTNGHRLGIVLLYRGQKVAISSAVWR